MHLVGDVVERSKSPSDQKKYKLLTLPNALQVVLISTKDVTRHGDDNDESDSDEDDEHDDDKSGDDDDDESEGDERMSSESAGEHSDASEYEEDGEEDRGGHSRRAGACLTVGVGSYAEPESLPGLAHYLEHMVFMGSEKYPNENEFESFLSAHGGFSNGSTDNELTNYMFEVGPEHLETALDMFAQFFIAPLMKPETMDRELSAIESEFSQATQNDRIRQQQVLCAESKKAHPYAKFGWGNRKSLKEQPEAEKIDVHKEIRAFYERYYSANIMKLVVCGEDTLEDMEKWVTQSYSKIPNTNVEVPSFASFGQPFGSQAHPSPVLCRIVPVRDIHTLQLDWMIPPIFGHYRQKPADYIASLLGHESEGSVLSLLKERGWISALTAGVTETDGNDSGTYGAKFDVTMKLTLEGISHWEEITHVVFEYLQMLEASDFPEWVFEELKALAEISFRFQEENSAVEKCEELAALMQDMYQVPAHDLLKVDLFQGAFDKQLVREILPHLSPENVFISLTTKKHGDNPDFQTQALEEEWFGVKYTKEDINDAVVKKWKAVGLNEKLQLPKPNPFIPRDFTLVENGAVDEISCHRFAFGKMWYKPDTMFATPRAHIAFLFHLPSVMQSITNVVSTELYVKLVRDALDEYAYHANVAEIMYSLRVKESGLELIVGGFNDKLGLLVKVVVEALFHTQVKAARFDIMKQEMLREYRNSISKVAHKAKYLRLQLLERVAFPLNQSIAALEATTMESLNAFLANALWNANTHLSSFAHGNISVEAATELRKMVEADLERVSSVLPASGIPQRFINQIPPTPSGLLIKARSEHKEEKNTQVEVYYQIGEHNLRTLAYADLLEQLMEEPLFDTLRTKQELGYDVSCTVRVTHGIVGFGVMVQSSLFDAKYISYCIDRFMIDFEEAIAMMPDEHFHDHVQAQILKKLEPDHNLLETTHRLWYEIASGRLDFDIDDKLAKEFETCTKPEMLELYHSWILQNPKKLSLHVIGQSSRPAKSVNGKSKEQEMFPVPARIKDLYAFKMELPFYPDNTRVRDEVESKEERTSL
uniref:Nardilysin n=1 Tax=Globisporangium ultimum (strain ATCC 200006 / CBS 805.95 / DAOM BR144) TaxID=431595 RepID=K3X3Y3_GLOUD